jgi:predicted Zn-ribbon and HTH transcriptional regulator
MDILRWEPLSARDISGAMHIPEKEVYGHLEHIRRTIHASGLFLEITPAECRSCGFVFAKRYRLTPPGRCPVCRGESVFEPLFAIRPTDPHPHPASGHPLPEGEGN